jgi:DNA primase
MNRHGTKPDVEEIKSRLTIERVGSVVFPGWTAGKSCKSPFRQDRTPSFSVFDNGRAWKDHAANEGGDVVSFYMKATGLDFTAALDRLSVMAGVYPDAPARKPEPKKELILPNDLHEGTAEELATVAKLRGINPEACQLAADRGLLQFGTVGGFPCWLLLDQTQKSAQARRMDGTLFPAVGSLTERKAHTLKGSCQSWPLGLLEAVQMPFLAIVEGGPDLLAALHFTQAEGAAERVGVVGMLGASNSIPADALPYFKNKRVRIFPHDDRAGLKAATEWEKQLQTAGAETDCFRVGGVLLDGGGISKDLNDLVRMDADAFENDRDLWDLFNRGIPLTAVPTISCGSYSVHEHTR